MILQVQVQSVGSKAADKTPVGHYFGQVGRKCENVGLWLICFSFAYFGSLFFTV